MDPECSVDLFSQAGDAASHRELPPGRLRGEWLVPGALLLGGAALYFLPGSFPPPSWMQMVTWLLHAVPVPFARFLPTAAQAVAFLLAWLVFIVIIWRARGWWWPQQRNALLSPVRLLSSQKEKLTIGRSPADPSEEPPSPAPPLEQGMLKGLVPASASPGQTIPLPAPEVQASRPRASASPVCLQILHTAISPGGALRSPCYEAGLAEIPLEWGAHSQEGIGWQVAACCHRSAEDPLVRQEDGLLVAAGVRHWPDQQPCVGPVGLLAVADGLLVQSDQGTISTSRLVIEALGAHLVPDLFAPVPLPARTAPQRLLTELQELNAALSEQLSSTEAGPVDTALCVLLLLGTTAYVAQVGDCRAYLYRQSEGLLQVTVDHRAAGADRATQELGEDLEEVRPRGRALYRSLGREAQVEADVFAVHLQSGDLLLLCSDGFWSGIAHEQLLSVLEEESQASQVSASRLCAQVRQHVGASGPLSLILLHLLPLKKLAAEEHAPAQTVRGKDRRERRRRGRKEPAPTRPPHRTAALERSEP